MALALTLSGRPVGASGLRRGLAAGGSAWAYVERDHAWLRAGDAICIAPPEAPGIALHAGPDDSVTLAPDATRPVGRIDALLRERQLWPLDGRLARTALERVPPPLVNAALRVAGPVVRAREQIEPTPPPAGAAASQGAFYDCDEVLTDTAALAGLSEAEEVLAERWLTAGERVLDVGCGTGREALAFAARGLAVVGVDVSRRSLDVARARAAEIGARAEFHLGAIEDLDLAPATFDAVYFGSDVYAGIPGQKRRVAALLRARSLLRPGGRVFLQAMPPKHRLRALALDGLRAAVARARGTSIEAGDRTVWYGPPPRRLVRHAFFSDEEVVAEIAAAGLTFVARCASYVVAERPFEAPRTRGTARPWIREVADVLRVFPRVEALRRRTGPSSAAVALREEARSAPRRDALGRVRLGRAIGLCDRLVPWGGGCYRRTLLEIALDAGAASEPLFLGFRGKDGHAWLERVSPGERYDTVVTV